eukprot:1822130-Amphidinium_carterae.1
MPNEPSKTIAPVRYQPVCTQEASAVRTTRYVFWIATHAVLSRTRTCTTSLGEHPMRCADPSAGAHYGAAEYNNHP